jgi:hypothetical protein
VLEDERSVLMVEVLVEPDAKRCSRQYPLKCSLAHGKRIAPHVIPIKLDQIECPHEHVCIMTTVPDTIKQGDAVIPTRDGFPVDNAGPRAQPRERLDNEREAMVRSLPGRL